MSNDLTRALGDVEVDRANLYREDVYTDLRIATLRVLTPVRVDGTPDLSRPTRYIGQTQLLSAAGPVPVQVPIEATSLDEAISKFPDAIRHGVDALIEEARQIQREEASRIIVPTMTPGRKIIS